MSGPESEFARIADIAIEESGTQSAVFDAVVRAARIAYLAGAEQMRERAARECDNWMGGRLFADRIRSLPIEPTEGT